VGLKILIVDDHALFRAGLRMLLATIGHDVVCIEAATIDEATALIDRHPDIHVCLVDLALKKENGLDAVRLIKELAPQVAVVVVSGVDDFSTIRSCLDAGAMSFIPKSVQPEVLTRALQHVLSGAVYLPEQIISTAGDPPQKPMLTPRQMQVLACLSRGLPTKLISHELSLSEHTVKEHIALIFQALGARNRTEAVIKATQLRLQELPATVRG
jgi:DNA-binding NarL/FixJ family response regulator